MEPTKTWDKLGFENPLKKTCLHDYTGETNKNVIDNPRTASAQKLSTSKRTVLPLEGSI